jgi:ankyrin repeat protein
MTFENVVKYCYEQLRLCDIELFLEHGNDINYQDPRPGPGYPRKGWTLLHYAASNGHRDVLKYLAAKGANLNIVDSIGWTALHYAVDLDLVVATQDGHMPRELPTVEVLLKLGADDSIADRDGRTARDILAMSGVSAVFDKVKKRAKRG